MNTYINSILVPTDFSETSENALKVGIAIAKRQISEITLLHVIDKFSYSLPREFDLPNIPVLNDVINKIEAKLNECVEKIHRDTGIIIKGKIIIGSPADTICDFSNNFNINLIVMGAHGTSGLRKYFIGSEAFKVVKNADCLVLTIPGNWKKTNFKKVLFPIRLIQGALDKYLFARPIIEKNGSELFILGLSDKYKPARVSQMALLMDKFKSRLYKDNVKFESGLCPCENFAEKVFDKAHEYDTDLIILTNDLDNDYKSHYVGSFAQQILNQSAYPVLSIKPISLNVANTKYLELAENWVKAINYSELLKNI
jgi:nucleotide-binding universal stress UspA family protein